MLYIRESTYTFGKAKLVLKDNKFFVESKYPEVLRELLRNPTVKHARVDEELAPPSALESSSMKGNEREFSVSLVQQEDRRTLLRALDEDDMEDDLVMKDGKIQHVEFRINQKLVQVDNVFCEETSLTVLLGR